MTFRTKLIAFNLSIIAALTLLTVYIGRDFRRLANLPAQQNAIEGRARSRLQRLAAESEVALATNDRAAIEKLLASFKEDPDLAFVRLWSKAGQELGGLGLRRTLAQTTARPKGRIDKVGQLVDDLIWGWRAVEIEGVQLGTVSVGYSVARIRAANARVTIFGVFIIVGAGLSGLLSLIFATRLTRPVLRMTQALRRMAAGELSQEPVTVKTRDEIGAMARAYNELLATLRQINDVAHELASGNLSVEVAAQGDLAASFSRMIAAQRAVLVEVVKTGSQLTATAAQFHQAAEKQARGAVDQSSVVDENRRTTDVLAESARNIAESGRKVLANAERTQDTSQLMADRIAALTRRTERISEILSLIQQIANKTEMLALNAALEGTKAGEVGRGFSLVATQMQSLAEDVMAAVDDVREVTTAITQATHDTVTAVDESTRLATDTTRSARQIAQVADQQRAGTEQLTQAMDGVAQVAHETASASKQIASASKDLVTLSNRLQELVGRFKFPMQK